MSALALLPLLLAPAAHAGDLALGDVETGSGDDTFLPGAASVIAEPVVNGEQVEEGDWEDAAAVYLSSMVQCTGVLIAPNLALTAGHCNERIRKIKVGVTDYRDDGETINVADAIEYPNSQSTYDITLMVLEEDAETPYRVIAQDCILDDYLYEGADVTIVGYGATDEYGYEYGTELLEGVTQVEDPECESRREGCNSSVSPGGELIAGGNGTDSCYGDSGGPLYLSTPLGDYLVGITSRGVDTSRVPCGGSGIYVRPDAIIDWIESESGVTLDRPYCGPPNEAPEATARPIVLLAREGFSRMVVVDPNEDDTHSFEVSGDPEFGTASVADDGTVSYVAGPDYDGEDSVVITVTDSGTPAMSVDVTIPIADIVYDGSGGCGCAAGGAGGRGLGLFGLLGLAGLMLRRRQG